MAYTKKNILVVEQNPVLRDQFSTAFLYSGYDVQITHRISEAVAMVSRGYLTARPFDLVVVDISDKKYIGLLADMQNINSKIPVFTLKDTADKSMVIELLNKRQAGFIEYFIQSYAGV